LAVLVFWNVDSRYHDTLEYKAGTNDWKDWAGPYAITNGTDYVVRVTTSNEVMWFRVRRTNF